MLRILLAALGAALLIGTAACGGGDGWTFDLGLDFGDVSVGEAHLDGTLGDLVFDDLEVDPERILLLVGESYDTLAIVVEDDRVIELRLRSEMHLSEQALDQADAVVVACDLSCPVEVYSVFGDPEQGAAIDGASMVIDPVDERTSVVTFAIGLVDGHALSLHLTLAHDADGELTSY